MKKILIIATLFSLLILSSSCSSNSDNNSSTPISNKNNSSSSLSKKEDFNDLQKKGLEIIENQSFWVELEKWGKVRFISSRLPNGGTYKLGFYLVNEKGKILYSFPEFFGTKFWFFYEFRAISFKDVDKDGLKDIIIIADYVTGAGEYAAIPFPVCSIYFQQEKEFINLPDLDEEINFAHKNENINMVLKFIEGKTLKFNK